MRVRHILFFGVILGMLLGVNSSLWAVYKGSSHVGSVGGYFDTEFVASDDDITFKAHRFILNAQAKPHKNIYFYSEIEFEYGALINAGDDNGELKIEQAWVDFIISESFAFRSGIILMPI